MRLAEILEWVNDELKRVNRASKLPAGVVFVGGGAKVPGLIELAKQELRLPAKIGAPDLSNFEIINPDLNTEVDDPEYACCLGLLIWGRDYSPARMSSFSFANNNWFKKVVDYFVP